MLRLIILSVSTLQEASGVGTWSCPNHTETDTTLLEQFKSRIVHEIYVPNDIGLVCLQSDVFSSLGQIDVSRSSRSWTYTFGMVVIYNILKILVFIFSNYSRYLKNPAHFVTIPLSHWLLLSLDLQLQVITDISSHNCWYINRIWNNIHKLSDINWERNSAHEDKSQHIYAHNSLKSRDIYVWIQ